MATLGAPSPGARPSRRARPARADTAPLVSAPVDYRERSLLLEGFARDQHRRGLAGSTIRDRRFKLLALARWLEPRSLLEADAELIQAFPSTLATSRPARVTPGSPSSTPFSSRG